MTADPKTSHNDSKAQEARLGVKLLLTYRVSTLHQHDILLNEYGSMSTYDLECGRL